MGTANAVQTGPVLVTCANGTHGTGWDNSNPYFEGKGNIAALYCDIIQHSEYVSDNLTDATLRYYQGLLPVDIPIATPETHTVQVPPSQETSTSPSLPQETETPVSIPETPTVPLPVESQTPVSDSPSVVIDSPTAIVLPVETPTETSESNTQTIPSETATYPIEIPLPTPVPVVEPQPVPQPVVVMPQPEPQPQPVPEPLPEVIDEEVPLEEPPLEETPSVEEPLPVEEPSELPVEEEMNESPIEETEILEPSEPTPEPSTQPVAEPAPVTQPDIAYVPPTVVLDNGVILTQEVAEQVALLQDPGELLSELFTNPVAVFAALGSVGADMSPAEREKAQDSVVSAVIVGSIVSQAAGAAAYRRKP